MLIDRIIKQQQKEYNKRRYINMRKEATKKRVTHYIFELELKTVLEQGYTQIKHTTIRDKMPPRSFTLIHKNGHQNISLAVYDGKEYKYFYSMFKDEKNTPADNPMPEFNKEFKNRTNRTLKQVFGSTAQYYKKYVPQPIYYKSNLFGDYVKIKNVCLEDYSSHYPAAAIEKLPNANTAKIVKGHILPNQEYQFAFYPNTGHIAIYDEFDTHDYTRMQLTYGSSDKDRKYKTDYLGHETETVLMKPAKEKIVELGVYYDIKNTYSEDSDEYKYAKLFLNKFLGMFQQNNLSDYERSPFAHLAAVIIWRANIKMFNLIKQIGEPNIIQVCVDGLTHVGPKLGNDTKTLGGLICKEENAVMIQRGMNQYIVFGKDTHKCHQGLDLNIWSNEIKYWKASEKVDFKKYINTICEVEEF